MGWLKYFIAAACVSVVVFFGTGSYFLWTTAQSEKQLTKQASGVFIQAAATLTHVNSTVDQIGTAFAGAAQSISQTEKDVATVAQPLTGVAAGLQTTVAKLNAECVPGPCGTIENTNKLINTSRLTVGQIEIAANNFDKNEAHFYQQEDQLYADADQSFNHFDSILTSPDLTGSLHNFNTVSHNLGNTTTDFQNKFHSFLYPPPCKGFRCYIKTGYEAIKVGSQLVEPAYYFWALTSGVHP